MTVRSDHLLTKRSSLRPSRWRRRSGRVRSGLRTVARRGSRRSTWSRRNATNFMDYNLYGGTCGVALFLAAAERFAPGSGYGELALAAVRPLQSVLDRRPDRLADTMGIGGARLGSVAYSLASAASWTSRICSRRRAGSPCSSLKSGSPRTRSWTSSGGGQHTGSHSTLRGGSRQGDPGTGYCLRRAPARNANGERDRPSRVGD